MERQINICKGKYLKSGKYGSLSKNVKNLLENLIVVDPEKRFSAKEALEHPWFQVRILIIMVLS